MPERIEVRISHKEIISLNYNSLIPYILTKLRHFGIPVRGILLFNGIESGLLEEYEDLDTQEYVFVYTK